MKTAIWRFEVTSPLGVSLRQGLVSALVATSLVLVLHHLAPFSGHTLTTLLAVFSAAALAAAAVGGT